VLVAGSDYGDSIATIGDIIEIINFVFKGGPKPLDKDADCNGTINVQDAVIVVDYIFRDGQTPCWADN
jgi:hypothetical protein